MSKYAEASTQATLRVHLRLQHGGTGRRAVRLRQPRLVLTQTVPDYSGR